MKVRRPTYGEAAPSVACRMREASAVSRLRHWALLRPPCRLPRRLMTSLLRWLVAGGGVDSGGDGPPRGVAPRGGFGACLVAPVQNGTSRLVACPRPAPRYHSCARTGQTLCHSTPLVCPCTPSDLPPAVHGKPQILSRGVTVLTPWPPGHGGDALTASVRAGEVSEA